MVELTSGMSLIVPLMVAALVSKLFGEMLCSGGIYDAHINLNNYPFLDNKNEYTYLTKASQVMRPQYSHKNKNSTKMFFKNSF